MFRFKLPMPSGMGPPLWIQFDPIQFNSIQFDCRTRFEAVAVAVAVAGAGAVTVVVTAAVTIAVAGAGAEPLDKITSS